MSPSVPGVGRSGGLALGESSSQPTRAEGLWEQVFSRANLARALRRVERNGGAAGVDGLAAQDLRGWLFEHWADVKVALDAGRYRPAPVRRVEIPKPDGGVRMLGVPTVLDRLIQQAIAQVLSPIFDPGFSESSFGFRPGRSAQGAVKAAQGHLADGYRWVVDIDLEKFFDRVGHDKLMHRVARKVDDKPLLRLIRSYLTAGMMVDGVVVATTEGTPQGSPLSPLLSNILLDDLDAELQRRGHRFVRYADDIRVFVRSERAAQRTFDGVTAFVEGRLALKVNRAKSSVATASAAGLLGFAFFFAAAGQVRLRVHPKARKRLKDRIRQLTRRNWGVSMEHRLDRLNRFIAGWMAYFGIADTNKVFAELDKWLLHRLRACRWKQWKRAKTKKRNLVALGVSPDLAAQAAYTSRGTWRTVATLAVNIALPRAYWHDLGLRGFSHHWQRRRVA